MKYGFRSPSIKRSFLARTKGRITRSVRRATSPFYGRRGTGLAKNPKRAIYNTIYRHTTFGLSDIAKTTNSAKSNNLTTGKNVHPYSYNTYHGFAKFFSIGGIICIILSLLCFLFSIKVGCIELAIGVVALLSAKHYRRIADE